ncbi:MAG TPA: RNase adapter RapZ [Elusimicrobiota bacterium]|nr:RNase adapter RapZ [Elusimicrobiota bacterium]
MEKILVELFEKKFGFPARDIAMLKGDGSDRKIFRLTGKAKSAIGVFNPDQKENQAFVGFSRHFRRAKLPVPEIYAEDAANGAYLEEDLGGVTLYSLLSSRPEGGPIPNDILRLYRQAVKFLPQFQIRAGKTLDYSLCYPRASFDAQSMLWDLNYFKYYFLTLAQVPFHEQALENDFHRFIQYLQGADRRFFLYRDFQSRNIMVKNDAPYFIDYQGGRKGALQYDIASLLYDAKADLPPEFRDELLARYIEEARKVAPINVEKFLRYYPGYVYIRIMQAMGAYGLRGFHQRKPHFLQSIPYAIRNIERLLRTTKLPVECPELLGVFKTLVASSWLRQFGEARLGLTVRVQSFSYRGGVPADEHGHGGGFVFDCRALPNPGRLSRYAKMTGKDAPVIAFLQKEPAVRRFLSHAQALLAESVDNYKSRNFTDLFVAFGCTGGRHRSVYCAETMAEFLRRRGDVAVEISHRGGEA